ncbi:hypothetical protein EV368DRAFT_44044 [Lentinula lateritia]|uniref:Uncharacterized protein n=1 Tax=Lentinula aff. lateritia TaxID=2804960 RepID=A0ACC1TY88_9AGAR|nr:hypothetical protein F5876DRAFT_43699 [Lentinula aff. lateritia]KAJ3851019.1 hypothetical protein EV368DRAFT_44044 [Lentinula lateritia]
MSSKAPFPRHEHLHEYSDRRSSAAHSRPHFPSLPDLRFEVTYLQSIQPYIRFHQRPANAKTKIPDFAEIDQITSMKTKSLKLSEGEDLIEIEWLGVLWITVRDQIISPLIQGTLWALVSFYVSPFSARVGHGLVERLPALPASTKKEGRGAGLLRDWLKGLGLSSSTRRSV